MSKDLKTRCHCAFYRALASHNSNRHHHFGIILMNKTIKQVCSTHLNSRLFIVCASCRLNRTFHRPTNMQGHWGCVLREESIPLKIKIYKINWKCMWVSQISKICMRYQQAYAKAIKFPWEIVDCDSCYAAF